MSCSNDLTVCLIVDRSSKDVVELMMLTQVRQTGLLNMWALYILVSFRVPLFPPPPFAPGTFQVVFA